MFTRFLALLSIFFLCTSWSLLSARESVTVYRDNYGVPHIYAASSEGVLYGLGYAQAEDNLEVMIHNYLRAAGRLSEFFGADDPDFPGNDWHNVVHDRLVRLCKVRKVAEDRYSTLDGGTRSKVEAFTAGVNTYIAEQGSTLPSWILAVTPVSPVDVVAFARWQQWTREYRVASDEMAGLYKRPTESNEWAIAPSKSASGKVMVQIDPHMGWCNHSRFYEAHIVGGEFNFSGGSIVGLPLFFMGHNDVFACACTANSVDTADVYKETLNQANTMYLFDGQWFPVESEPVTIEILGMGPLQGVLRYTHGGERVILAWDGENHTALSARLVSGSEVDNVTQGFAMMSARNLGEFKQALAMRQISSGNYLYGDVDGNIYYIYNARQPTKSILYDWNRPVDGTTSATEWGPIMAFHDLPQEENPASNYLINNNVAPWYVTEGTGIDQADYPYYLFRKRPDGSGGAAYGYRQRRAADLIGPDMDITLHEMKEIAFDHYLIVAEWAKLLVEESINDPIAKQSAYDPLGLLDAAWQILDEWDNNAVVQSAGPTLFTLLYSYAPSGLPALEPPDPSTLTLANKISILNALAGAARSIHTAYGTLHVPWGDVHRIRRGGRSFPVNGGSGISQSLRLVNIDSVSGNVGYCSSGSAYMMTVELGDPVRAFSAIPLGQTDDPHSPHFDDLTELYCNDEPKPAYFTLGDVLANLESVKVLNY